MARDPAESAGASASPEDLGRPLLDEAHGSLVDYLRLVATSSGGEVEEEPTHLAFAGAHVYPGTYTNGVIRSEREDERAITAVELLARADAFFGRWPRPYVVWLRGYADRDLEVELQRRGCEPRSPAAGSPAIFVERERLRVTDAREVVITETRDERDLVDYLHLLASAYGLPEADLVLVEGLLVSRAALQADGSRVHLAHDRGSGELVGGTSTYVTGRACHAAWNVVAPVARGRGIGPALMTWSAREAFDRGADFLWAVASQMGAPVWNRVGIRTVAHYQRYVVPAPDAPPASSSPTRSRRGAARPIGAR